ncbi:hypothetical protein Tco_0615514 [Tanacetum coccineum]
MNKAHSPKILNSHNIEAKANWEQKNVQNALAMVLTHKKNIDNLSCTIKFERIQDASPRAQNQNQSILLEEMVQSGNGGAQNRAGMPIKSKWKEPIFDYFKTRFADASPRMMQFIVKSEHYNIWQVNKATPLMADVGINQPSPILTPDDDKHLPGKDD